MKKFIISVFLIFCCTSFCGATDFGMKPAHFGPVMEYYYQKPQPEKIKPLLRTMAERGVFNLPENRLLFAAFFGELLETGKLLPESFAQMVFPLGKNARRMAAWAIRFAGVREDKKMVENLLGAEDKILERQILASPRLDDWTLSEPTVIPMFWAAYMATGDNSWVDKIISAAMGGNGRTAQVAAASLFDFAPRHPPVIELIREKERKATGNARNILAVILDHAGRAQGTK